MVPGGLSIKHSTHADDFCEGLPSFLVREAPESAVMLRLLTANSQLRLC